MKVKKLLKVISSDTDVALWDNYGGGCRIGAPTNIQINYSERKVERVWIDTDPFPILNITIEGVID